MKRIKQKPEIKKKNEKVVKNGKSKGNVKKDRISTFFNKYGLYILIGSVILIGFFAFKDFLTAKYIFFFTDIGSDSVNQDLPAIIQNSEYLGNSYSERWSFYNGMGGARYRSVPVEPLGFISYLFDYLAYSISGANYFVAGRFLRMFIFNFLLSGIIFYYYLRTISVSKFSSIIGALLITFSGYMVLGSSWGFSGHVFRAVFMLFAFEQLYVKKRWYFFPFAVLYASGNLFVLYLYAIFIITYGLFRYFSSNSSIKGWFILSGKMLIAGIAGLMLNLINIWPQFEKMFFSPRVSGNASLAENLISGSGGVDYSSHGATALLRFFSNDILGSGTQFEGWYNYFEAPVFYIGLFTLLIFSQIYTLLKKRELIFFSAFFLFWLMSVLIPDFRYLLSAYTGDYYRYGFDFFIPFLFLFSAIYSLNKLEEKPKINYYVLGGTLFLLLLILFFPHASLSEKSIDPEIRKVVVILLILYSGTLILFSKEGFQNAAKVILFVLIFVELSYFSYRSFEDRTPVLYETYKRTKAGYADGTIDAVKYIHEKDKDPFFRTEKDYESGNTQHSSLNDAQAQGYYGTTSYSSFNQLNYIRFLEETGVIQKGDEIATRWSPGFRGLPLMQTFGNVKYHLSRSLQPEFMRFGYDSLARIEGITILKNKYSLPFGYTYDKYIRFDDFKKLITYKVTAQSLTNIYKDLSRSVEIQKVNQLLSGVQSLLNIEYPSEVLFKDAVLGKIGKEDTENYFLQIAKYSTANFKIQTALLSAFVYEDDLQSDLSGLEQLNIKDTTHIISPEHFNFEIYKLLTDGLKEDTFAISDFSQTDIKGNIRLNKKKLLFFTIPYDQGWKANVNGEDKQLERVNIGFTGLMLDPGDYEVELYYEPEKMKIAKMISIASIILFWLYLGYYVYKKRRKSSEQ